MSENIEIAELLAIIRSEGAKAARDQILEVGKAGEDTEKKVKKASDVSVESLGKMAKKALIAAGAFLSIREAIGFFAQGSRVTAQFEASISDLAAITGAAGKDLEFYTQQAKEMGRTTTLSASQAAEAFKLVASAKPDLLENKEALAQVTREAVVLAEASGSTLPEAAMTLGSALNQMGEGADQASRYINVLAAGSKLGASEVGATSAALRDSGTVAAAAGISFETLNASIQTLSTVSITAEKAGVGLRGIILKLQKQANDEYNPAIVGMSQALQNLNRDQLSTNELLDLFGLESITAAQALINNAQKVADLEKNLTGTNIAYEQQRIRVNNLQGDLKGLGSAYEALQLHLNTVNNQGYRVMVQTMTDLINTFIVLEGEQQGSSDAWSTVASWLVNVYSVANRVRLEFVDLGDLLGAIGAAAAAVFTGDFAGAKRIVEDREATRAALDKEIEAWDSRTDAIKASLALTGEARDAARRNLFGGFTPETTFPTVQAGGGGAEDGGDGGEGERTSTQDANYLKALEGRYEALQESLRSREDLEYESYQKQMELLWEYAEAKNLTDAQIADTEAELFMQHQDRLLQIEMQSMSRRKAIKEQGWRAEALSHASFLQGLTATAALHSKEAFEINKLATQASILLSTYDAVTGAYAFGAKIGGPVLGGIYAGVALLAQTANYEAASAAQFGGGGAVPSVASTNPGTPSLVGTLPAVTPDSQNDSRSRDVPAITVNLSLGNAVVTDAGLRSTIRDVLLPGLRDIMEVEGEILFTQSSQQFLEINQRGG